MTNTSKWCLLNTDLRSVSNAALRKLWHSYQRFWNAPIVVLIIIIAHWRNDYYLVAADLAADSKMQLRGIFFWLGFVKMSGVGGVGVMMQCACAGVVCMDGKIAEQRIFFMNRHASKRNWSKKRKLHRKGAFQNLRLSHGLRRAGGNTNLKVCLRD